MLSGLIGRYRRAFAGLPRRVWKLAFITLVHRSGTMVLPFLSLYVTRELGMTPQQAGGILGVYGLGAISGAFLGGKLSDRIGPNRAQLLSLLAAAVGFLALSAARDPLTLTLTVFFAAIAAESFRPSNAAAIADASPSEVVFRAFALRRLAINLGMTFGPAVGGFLAVYDYFWLFICDALTCLLAAVGLFFLLPQSRTPAPLERDEATEVAEGPPISPWRDRPYLGLLGLVTVFSLVFFQVLTTYPLTLREEFGFQEHAIGLLFAINPILIILFEMVLVDAVARFQPVRVAAVGALLTCVGLGMLPLSTGVPFLAFTIMIWTTGEMLSHPMLEGLAAERPNAASRGAYLGLYNATLPIAFILGPPLGTWIYQDFGYRTLWFACAALGVVLGAAFWAIGPALARQQRHQAEG